MERINARRANRGQEKLINVNNYEEEDQPQHQPQRKPAFPSERPSALDQYKGQKSLSDRMAERPSALGQPSSMESRRAIADEEFKKKFGRGQKGISTPMTKDAMDRVMGTA